MIISKPTKARIGSIKAKLDKDGWFVHNKVVSNNALLNKYKTILKKNIKIYQKAKKKNGISTELNKGTLHHIILNEPMIIDLLDVLLEEYNDIFEYFFDGKYILHTIGGNILGNTKPYYGYIHRDIRVHTSDVNLMCQMIIPLVDFTKTNGSTLILSGSHKKKAKPSDAHFIRYAEKAVAKKGGIIFFNSNCWHAAGKNMSRAERPSLIITMSSPIIKPQYDYINLIGSRKVSKMSKIMKQFLGYFSRVPSTLNQWTQPYHKRYYRNNQHKEYYQKITK